LKDYNKLTIRDHFMFGKICLNIENCRIILNALLGENISVDNSDIEKFYREYDSSKYIRLDLLVKDTTGTIYNGEIQHKSKNPERQMELPLRSRYYQAMLDTANLPDGSPYSALPETYIIFICTYDPFGQDLPLYTFTTKCEETDLPIYNDKTYKLFFNTKAELNNLPQQLKNMLQYFETGEANDVATRTLDNQVMEARKKEKWREEYMLTLVHDKDVYVDGFDDGFSDGFEDGFEDGFKDGFNSRQQEVDSLNNRLSQKESDISHLMDILAQHGINPDISQ